MAARQRTDYLVVHCSATRPEMDVGAFEIRQWHKAKGWQDIGYHRVIRRNGEVESGREIWKIGSHVHGLNAVSVGICLVGGLDQNMKPSDNFTAAQKRSLRKELIALQRQYPGAKIVGHRDVIQKGDPPKDCPCFDVRAWFAA